MIFYNVPAMDIKKILFFKPGAIGDLLHTLPALAALKGRFPAAHITLVVSPVQADLVEALRTADLVITFDKQAAKKSLRFFVDYARMLRRERYDLFVDMQPSLRSFALRIAAGAAVNLVYRKQKHAPRGCRRMHAVENFLDVLKPLGISGADRAIRLPLADKPRAMVERLLRERELGRGRPLVALNASVGSARPARNWFPERFAGLADRLIADLRADVIFIGGAEDRGQVAEIMQTMRLPAVSFAGELSLPQTAALLARCSCLVSSDTGPLHLSTAVQTPVVGLFGSTDPARTGPVGGNHVAVIKNLDCVPCEQKYCPKGTRQCMAEITVDEVFSIVADIITARILA